MKMKKGKSKEEIHKQYLRIARMYDNNPSYENNVRLARAADKAEEYSRNISGMKRSKADMKKFDDQYEKDKNGAQKFLDRNFSRKYARSTYMGYNVP